MEDENEKKIPMKRSNVVWSEDENVILVIEKFLIGSCTVVKTMNNGTFCSKGQSQCNGIDWKWTKVIWSLNNRYLLASFL